MSIFSFLLLLLLYVNKIVGISLLSFNVLIVSMYLCLYSVCMFYIVLADVFVLYLYIAL